MAGKLDGLAAQEGPTAQEEVVTGRLTKDVVNNPTISNAEPAPPVQVVAPGHASDRPAFRDVFGDEGEVWFYPNKGFHTPNYRGQNVPQGRQSIVTAGVDVGQDRDLTARGRASTSKAPASLEVVPGDSQTSSSPGPTAWPAIGDIVEGVVSSLHDSFVWMKVVNRPQSAFTHEHW